MVVHNDRHEMLKEEAQKLATQARKDFRKVSYDDSPLVKPDKTKDALPWKTGKTSDADKLRMANREMKTNQELWDGHSRDYEKRIKQLEEEKNKLMNQILHVGVKNYQRKLKRTKEMV